MDFSTGPEKNNRVKMTMTGISIMNHPSLLFKVGPHVLVECLPYGTVILNKTGSIITAKPIQIKSAIKNIFSEIMAKYNGFL